MCQPPVRGALGLPSCCRPFSLPAHLCLTLHLRVSCCSDKSFTLTQVLCTQCRQHIRPSAARRAQRGLSCFLLHTACPLMTFCVEVVGLSHFGLLKANKVQTFNLKSNDKFSLLLHQASFSRNTECDGGMPGLSTPASPASAGG